MIKCITFDLDDTLWKIEPVIIEAEINFNNWLKKNYPIIAENHDSLSLRKLMKQTALENPEIKHDLSAIRIKGYTHLKNLYQLPETMPTRSFEYFMKYRNKVKLFDGVERTLKKLKENYLIGTITNGNASLEKIGLNNLFDFETKAADIGFMKPDPKIFQAAIKKAKCKSNEIVHVGDSYEKDIIGAKSANMNYIWLKNENNEDFDINASKLISSITEVPELLKNW